VKWLYFSLGICLLLLFLVVYLEHLELNIELSPEEILLLKKYAYFNNRQIIRWSDNALITIYDETRFPEMDEVVSQWNKVLEPFKVRLILIDNPFQAKVRIQFMKFEDNIAGWATIYYNTLNNHIEGGVILIDPLKGYNLITYLHEFGHILGIKGHFLLGLMSPSGQFDRNEKIDENTKRFIQLLYSLPIKYRFD